MRIPVSSSTLVRGLLGLILAAAGIALYLVEWVDVTLDEGYSAEALRQPYLAAEQFLALFSIEVESRDGLDLLDDLPSTEHTLLITSSRRALSERRRAALLDWAADGGRLILLASDLWDEEQAASGDRMLDDLNVMLLEVTDEELLNSDEANETTADANITEFLARTMDSDVCGTPGSLGQISLPGQEQEIAVSFHDRRFLLYEGDLEFSYAENEAGSQLLYLVVGEGAVVVTTTLDLWRNRIIGCHDHAHLLRWLTDDRSVLWWLFNTEMPPLHSLIWQRWPIAVLLALALIALWAWRSGFRIKRIPGERDPARRELMEHVNGVARFLWQHGEADSMLQALRRSVLGSHGGNSAETERLMAKLSERSGMPVPDVHRALFGTVGKDAAKFVEVVRRLQTLRMHL